MPKHTDTNRPTQALTQPFGLQAGAGGGGGGGGGGAGCATTHKSDPGSYTVPGPHPCAMLTPDGSSMTHAISPSPTAIRIIKRRKMLILRAFSLIGLA